MRRSGLMSGRDWTKPEPKPVKTNSQEVWPLVIAQLDANGYEFESTVAAEQALLEACRQRHVYGVRKYGMGLQVENGRDPLRDLLDEALDAVAYSRQNYERTRTSEDWDLHREAVQFAARVMDRILRKERAHG